MAHTGQESTLGSIGPCLALQRLFQAPAGLLPFRDILQSHSDKALAAVLFRNQIGVKGQHDIPLGVRPGKMQLQASAGTISLADPAYQVQDRLAVAAADTA